MKKNSQFTTLFRSNGFTLIELLTAFSLITIIAGVGFASLVSYSRSQAVTQAEADVKQAVDTARFNALSNVRPSVCAAVDQLVSYNAVFCINGANAATCLANSIPDNGGYLIQATCGVQPPYTISAKKLPSGLSFSSVAGNCSNVGFLAVSATVSGGSCNAKITGYNKSATVVVDSTGYVSY